MQVKMGILIYAFAIMFPMAIALGVHKIIDVISETIKDKIQRKRLDRIKKVR